MTRADLVALGGAIQDCAGIATSIDNVDNLCAELHALHEPECRNCAEWNAVASAIDLLYAAQRELRDALDEIAAVEGEEVDEDG